MIDELEWLFEVSRRAVEQSIEIRKLIAAQKEHMKEIRRRHDEYCISKGLLNSPTDSGF